MIACYDLARCPPTYDAVAFLALAERERLRRGDECVDVRILPGPASGFRADGMGTWPHTVADRVEVRDRVLVPLCRLLPSARSVELAESRRQFVGEWGFGQYFVGLPRIVEALRGGYRPLRGERRRQVGGSGNPDTRPLVTLTLREAEHHPLRNSRSEEWGLAAEELASMGFAVVILRDARLARTPMVGDRRSGVVQLGDAPTDLWERAAAYATAAVNVGVSNGPMWMSIFMAAPTLMIRPVTDAAGGCYDSAFFRRHGVPRGGQLPASPPNQRLVWEEDSCAVIVRSVVGMLEDISA